MKVISVIILISSICWITPNLQAECSNDRPCGPASRPFITALVPQGFAGADFRPACREHDRCYKDPSMSKAECDRAYKANMLNSCQNSRHPILCRCTARFMVLSVKLFGRR